MRNSKNLKQSEDATITSSILLIMKTVMLLRPFLGLYIHTTNATETASNTRDNQRPKQLISSLSTHSWQSHLKLISDKYGVDTFKILKRNIPDIFVNHVHESKLKYSEWLIKAEDALKGEVQFNSELDLSDLNLKTIPDFVLSRMKNVEKLTLSNNPSLKFEDNWFKKMPKANIKTLIYQNKIETNKSDLDVFSAFDKPEFDIDIFSEFPNLESLTLSLPSENLTTSRGIVQVLEKLTHLDISECESVSEDLIDCIFNNCKNLKSLHFKSIPLKSYFSSLPQKIVNATNSGQFHLATSKILESLELVNCSLDHSCLKDVFNFTNLKRINLKKNSFAEITEELIADLFKREADECFSHETPYKYASLNSLEDIDLSETSLKSVDLIRKFLDLKTLKSATFFKSFNNVIQSCEKLFEPLIVQNLANPLATNDNLLNNPDFYLDESNFRNYRSASSLKNLVITNLDVQNNLKFKNFLHQFKYLESLDISHCSLQPIDDSFSFGSLVDTLTSLKINEFLAGFEAWEVHILDIISKFKNLKYLEASNNNFSGFTKPITFNSQDSLETIKFEKCKLNQFTVEACLNCRKIKTLDLSVNNLSGLQISSLKPNQSLRELNINFTSITTKQLDSILSNFPKLKVIKAQNNHFQDAPDGFRFSNVPLSLITADIGCSSMNFNFFRALTYLPLHNDLAIYSCDFSNKTDIKLGPSIYSLTSLEFKTSKVNYHFLKTLSVSTNLKSLSLESCTFIPSADSNLQIETFCPALEKLILDHFSYPELMLSILNSIPKLEYLLIKEPHYDSKKRVLDDQIARLKSQNPNLDYELVDYSSMQFF